MSVGDAIGVYLELGVDGTGTAYFDAVSLSEATAAAQVNFIIGTDGEHTLEYYSVDRAGNSEAISSVDIDIDQTPPGNWTDAGAFRGIGGGSSAEH